jgi:general secretion pathway protein D
MILLFRVAPVVLLGVFSLATQAQDDKAGKAAPAAPARAQPVQPPRAATPVESPLPAAPLPAPAAVPPVTTPPPAAPRPPEQQAAPALKPGEVLLNFQAADIQAVVKAVSQMTNRNFLLDPRVKGQITILSAKPMTAGAAYQVFLSALKAQGFTAVEGTGGVVRVIPTGEAKLSADVSEREKPAGGEQIVTHVASVQHVSATQLVPILRPLMAPTSQLSAYEPGNLLILTDYAENVRRMLRIIERVDLPATTDVTVVPLVHASALDLAELITRLASAVGAGIPGAPVQAVVAGGDRFSIVPDLRTNSLLIRTENPGRLAQMRSLIAKLDVPAKSTGNTRVIYLKNAEAAKIAEVLRGLLAGEARASQAASAAAGAARPPSVVTRAAEASLIQADEATNSLIINASDAVYNNLRGVIEQLDVRRSQVFVEALIVEISTDKANELGFQWTGGRQQGNGVAGAVTNYPAAKPGIVGAVVSPATALSSAAGLTVAFLGEEITLPDGSRVRSLGGLARALESQDLGNVLSTPNLMTLDNAEAKIVVGQNVPFITGSFAQATGTTGAVVNPFQTIERKDVGLTLKIKPQISDGGTIKLDIYQEISSVATTTGASDLITRKRSVETKVVVDDGNTVVLGGLIEDTIQETQQAVPLLGRIPLLGALFRYKEQVNKKTNLMVFLRPTIVRTAQDGFNVTVDRYNYLRAKGKDRDEEGSAILDRLAPVTPPAPKPKPAPGPTPGSAPTPPPAPEPAATIAPETPKPETPAAPTPTPSESPAPAGATTPSE